MESKDRKQRQDGLLEKFHGSLFLMQSGLTVELWVVTQFRLDLCCKPGAEIK